MVRGMLPLAFVLLASAAAGDPLPCDLSAYRPASGLTASAPGDALTVDWDGEDGQQLRLQWVLAGGTPVIRDLAIRRDAASPWSSVARGLTPEFRVVSGLRRVTEQQLRPLRGLGVDITSEVVDAIKWEAFWDAPLNVPGGNPAHGNATPPVDGIAHQPGLPRRADEVKRADAVYRVERCQVTTRGSRIEVTFPGVTLGVFSEGRLEYQIYKGSNLIKQTIVAKTEEPSVAYKYDAGLKGLAVTTDARMVWRDITNLWQGYRFTAASHEAPVPLRAANRLVVAETAGGAIAAFPPPHRFFWVREIEVNLGYNWYRNDGGSSFAFGIRQAEREDIPVETGRGPEDTSQNFALYSARPGTWQQMPVFFYVGGEGGQETFERALAFTRQDQYKPLPGYQVMAQHFHTSPVSRMRDAGGLDVRLPDFDAMRAVGVNIFGPVGPGAGGRGADEVRLQALADYHEVSRRHSDSNFLIMPNEEVFSGVLGGHVDFLFSKPVFWIGARKDGEPFVEQHAKYGAVYRVGTPQEMMEMAARENIIMYMPHPRSKGSTGFPDAVKETDHFRHEQYRGIGYRWGMGVDGSETRLCEYRCLDLLDDMNNWVADVPTPPKYLHAITETYRRGPGDDIYANNPVSYVKLSRLPTVDDMTTIVDAMKRGDYFVTSGEVLIPSYALQGSGDRRTMVAELEWTFPLDFVEVVWGDGHTTGRQVISAADLPAFGRHRFEIPIDARGKKWVRFAAWDVAGNGALVQPIKLTPMATTSAR